MISKKKSHRDRDPKNSRQIYFEVTNAMLALFRPEFGNSEKPEGNVRV